MLPSAAVLRLLMTIEFKRNWLMHHVDIKTAYFPGMMDCDVYMKTLDGDEKK
jgi:hypothetical protein